MIDRLKKIFQTPKSNYKNQYDLIRFDLTWKMMWFNTISFFILCFFYFFSDYDSFYPCLYAFCTSALIHFGMYKKRNYKIFGFLYIFHGILFLGAVMLLFTNIFHVIEYFWFLVFALYTFYIFGNKAGYLIIFISLFFISLYFLFRFEENISQINGTITPIKIVATILNLMAAAIFFGYLINQFNRSRQIADKKYTDANYTLMEQNKLIFVQNEEKTIMLKEIHHRVKNNLQVISSLLRLQSYEADDENVKKMFDTSVNRISAMALIHEKMYQKDNLSKINIADYLKSLGNEILKNYAVETDVNFKISSELEILGNRTIVPLALIFNELISNTLKYAFVNRPNGEIEVYIKQFSNDWFTIEYRDNGHWKVSENKKSFGLELIETFTEQLDGEYSRQINDEGTIYRFRLKNIE